MGFDMASKFGGLIEEQLDICRQYGASWVEASDHLKVGLARNVTSDSKPLNGLRHPPQGDTTGWYIWAGDELSTRADFFEPVHVAHLRAQCPQVLRFLGLPPGWRFLIAGTYVDVWEDPKLLEI